MKYNLTPKQKAVATTLVSLIRDNKIGESFVAVEIGDQLALGDKLRNKGTCPGDFMLLDALRHMELLVLHRNAKGSMDCTATGKLYSAVDSNFAEDTQMSQVLPGANVH